MTTARTSLARRLTAPALAVLAGTGIVLAPGLAQAGTAAPASTAVAAPAVMGFDAANAAKVRGDGYWCC